MNGESKANANPGSKGLRLGASLLVLVLAVWALISAQSPPDAKALDAPDPEFSAMRAAVVLGRVLDASLQQAHPIGSQENARVRARIMTELGRLQLNPEIRAKFVCASYGVCGTPYNIMARVPGRDHSKLVVLSTHYDSVFAGPGAGDAGASVAAIIEIARALKSGPPLAHDVLLLIDDGEEAGLLGARAFMQEPEAKQVRAFINMEARGTSGLSRLFETSDGNATFARLFAESLPHPSTSSLYYEIYKLLPNDTDLSVFKAEGGTGVGMAFIGGPLRYHTPVDDLAHLDLRTLQDQGDSALALARAFVAEPGALKATSDAVYFDVFGQFVAYWPMALSLPLCVAALLLAGLARVRLGSERPSVLAILGGLLLSLLLLALNGLAGWMVLEALKLFGLVETRWQQNLFWPSLTFMLMSVLFLPAAGSRVFKTFRVNADRTENLLFGWMLLLWLLSLLLWQVLPGALYLTLLPVLLAAPVWAAFPRNRLLAATVLSLCTVITLGPMLASLYESLGSGVLFVLTPLTAIVLLPWAYAAPETITRPVRLAALLLGLLGLSSTLLVPRFSVHEPMPLAATLVQGPESSRLSFSTEVTPASKTLRAAIGTSVTLDKSLPWNTNPNLLGPVLPDVQALPPPGLSLLGTTTEGAEVIWTFELRSTRFAPVLGFVHPAAWGRSAVQINGVGTRQGAKYDRDALSGGFLAWYIYASEATFTIRLPLGETPSGYFFDRSSGLPAGFESIDAARIQANAMPVHAGDGVLIWRAIPDQWPELEAPAGIAGGSPTSPSADVASPVPATP